MAPSSSPSRTSPDELHRQEPEERVQPHHSRPALRLCGVRRHRRPDQAQAHPGALSSLQGRPVRRAEPHHRRLAHQVDRRRFPEGGARGHRAVRREGIPGRKDHRPLRLDLLLRRPTTSPTPPNGATSRKSLRDDPKIVRAFYLAIAPDLFGPTCEYISKKKLLPPRRPRGDRKAARPRSRIVDRDQRRSLARSSTKIRSTASITTSAKRRCRTCWRCASPTSCSSRSGTPPISTTCRSPWPKASAPARAAITTRAARCAT